MLEPDRMPAAGAKLSEERLWRRLSYACAMVVAFGVAYCLIRMPFQVSDNVGYLLSYPTSSLWEQLVGHINAKGFMRPLLWGQHKVLFDMSGGQYFLTFKAFHIFQVVALLVLFVRLLDVRSVTDFVLVPLSTVLLIGIHTFNGTVREAFPVNHYMTILVCCLLASNLSFSKGGWWIDWLALLVFAYALFTVETGILVWVCLVAGYCVGFRGVSAKAIVSATVLLAVYFYLRFGPLGVGAPGLMERSSGFGFSIRERTELAQMFADGPLRFYAYNVASSVLTVLFSEPRAGVWVLTRSALQGGIPPWLAINVVASVLATLVIGRFALTRFGDWVRRDVQHGDRLFIVFIMVLLANAGISFPYTKDVVMSPAGVFYALAAFVAMRDFIEWITQREPRLWVAVTVSVALLIMSSAWSMRALGLAYSMRYTAFSNRNEWATISERLDEQDPGWRDPVSVELVGTLRARALGMPVPSPFFPPRWSEKYFDFESY